MNMRKTAITILAALLAFTTAEAQPGALPTLRLNCDSTLVCDANNDVSVTRPYSAGQAQSDMAPYFAPLSVALPTYDTTGAAKTPSHVTVFSCTLVVGTCTVTFTALSSFTSATTYFCWVSDQAATAVLSTVVPQSGTSIKVYGTLTDSVRGGCIGW